MKTAIAIRHVHFEDLGSLEPALERAGYKIRYADCCVDEIAALDPVAPDWHGDTFDLPERATLLASTGICRNQASSGGRNALGFEFHPEATAAPLERWFIGHACELAGAKLSVATLRTDTIRQRPLWRNGWCQASCNVRISIIQ